MQGYEKRVYFCPDCGEFEANTESYSQCKCGKNDIKVMYDSGYQYNKHVIDRKHFEILVYENRTYQSDFKVIEKYTYPFFKMNEFQQKVYDKIKTFEIIGKYETFETLQDDSKQLGYFDFNLSGQTYKEMYVVTNEISFSYRLTSMQECDSEKLTKSLLNFYKMIRYVEKGRINLNTTKNREMLKDMFDYETRQVEAYNYTFYV